jgi:hypothetical protein
MKIVLIVAIKFFSCYLNWSWMFYIVIWSRNDTNCLVQLNRPNWRRGILAAGDGAGHCTWRWPFATRPPTGLHIQRGKGDIVPKSRNLKKNSHPVKCTFSLFTVYWKISSYLSVAVYFITQQSHTLQPAKFFATVFLRLHHFQYSQHI